MPADDPTKIRNVAIVGQGGVGKTLVADALLFASNAATRIGRTEDGSSAFDIEPEEQRRRSSITSGLHHCTWRKTDLNIIDTPGYSAFIHDSRNCLYGASGVVFVLGAGGGEIKVEAEKLWRWCDELGLARVGFVARLDRERASIANALEDLKALGVKPAVLQVPIGAEAGLEGVVDLLSGKAFVYKDEKVQETQPPAALADEIAAARDQLVETIAEANDELLEKYLEGTELTPEELRAGLHEGTHAGKFLPILCGAAIKGIGMHPLLDAVVDLLPSPAEQAPWKGTNPKTGDDVERSADPNAPFSAYVFKTLVDPFAGKLSVMRIVSGKATTNLDVVNTYRDGRERLGHLLKIEGKKQSQVPVAVAGDVIALAKLKDTATGDTLADEKHPVVYPPTPDTPPAISFALSAKSKADDDKLMTALHRLMEEDTALRVHRDEQTKEFVVSGSGQLH